MKFVAGLFAVLVGMMTFSGQAAEPKQAAKKYGDWGGQCAVNQKTKVERCSIFQAKVVKQGEKVAPVLVAHVGKRNKKNLLTLRFPHGVSLPHQYTIKIDSGKASKRQFLYCNAKGCYGEVPLDNQWISAMKKGFNAVVTFKARGGKDISIKVSLKGFTAGFNSIK